MPDIIKYTVDEIKQIMHEIEYRMWEVEIIETLEEDQQFSYHTMRLIFGKISEHLRTLNE